MTITSIQDAAAAYRQGDIGSSTLQDLSNKYRQGEAISYTSGDEDSNDSGGLADPPEDTSDGSNESDSAPGELSAPVPGPAPESGGGFDTAPPNLHSTTDTTDSNGDEMENIPRKYLVIGAVVALGVLAS